MTIYRCKNCFRDFNQKCHLDNHLTKKKKPCVNKNVNMTANNTTYYAENPLNSTQISTQTDKKSLKTPHNLHTNFNMKLSENIKDDNDVKKHVCKYCNLSCARSDSLNRHIDKYCKNKKHIENVDVIESKINAFVLNVKLEKDNLKLQEDNKKLIEILEEYKLFIKEKNLVKQSISSIHNSNNNTHINNNTNNNTNNGSIINANVNNTTTINHIVQFGKEDISKCNLAEMMNIYLKSTGGNIFANILKYLNFNPNFPENFNILMSDLARENVKVHNGKKFITKKFKNVKDDIFNSLSTHITNMCDTYVEDPKTKKSADILSKMKINDISVKLINNDDIIPLLTIKKEVTNKDDNKSVNSNVSEDYLDLEGEKKLVHYENKRQGLQEIASQRLKDELYNNKDLIEKHYKL